MLTILSACSSMESWDATEETSMSGTSNVLRPLQSGGEDNSNLEASKSFQQDYKNKWQHRGGNNSGQMPTSHTKNVNHYVRGIMQDLITNLQYVNSATPMAVSSFVFLDSNYESSTILGNQIAEGFIHEVHKLGIPIIDYKTTDFIRVTPQGDFSLSKDFLDLSMDMPIKYVLTGTLVQHQSGVMVNARIVGIASKAVVATAQGFIPSHITNHIMNSELNDGIPVSLLEQ